MYIPVYWHGTQTKYRCGYCANGNEIIKNTVSIAEYPVTISHVNIVENTVEYCHEEIRNADIYYESIGNWPHMFVSCKKKNIFSSNINLLYFWSTFGKKITPTKPPPRKPGHKLVQSNPKPGPRLDNNKI